MVRLLRSHRSALIAMYISNPNRPAADCPDSDPVGIGARNRREQEQCIDERHGKRYAPERDSEDNTVSPTAALVLLAPV